jgi:hypothetical protein
MSNRSARSLVLPVLLLSALGLGAAAASCGGGSGTDTGGGGGDGGLGDGTVGDGAGGDGNAGGDAGVAGDGSSYACDGCATFPPIGTTACAPSVLGPASIAYPTDGLLLPPNMNVLEVQFVPPAGATLYEVDFENAITDVRVETSCNAVPDVRGGASKGCGVTLPQAAWNDIANKNRDGDALHVTVRATINGACVTTSTAKIDLHFAKEDLAGGIYYWQAAVYGGIGGKTGGIYSHDFGTFDPTPTPFYTSGGTGTCVGCHNVSRDGARMALATDDPDGDDEFADVKTHVMDIATRSVIGGSTMSPGFQTFSHDHTKMIASTYKTATNTAFAVFNGDGTTVLATATLPGGMKATQPDLSRDDKTLVYVVPAAGSISMRGDHHFTAGSLYASTFDAATNAIGAPTLLLAGGTRNYYYPSTSASVNFVLFNDAPQPGDTATTNDDAFYNRGARVKLLHYPPQQGDVAIDLAKLNVADGLTNSWPRWSPFVQTYKGHKLLWVTFSSNRDYGLHLVNKGFDNCYPPESPAYDLPQPLSKQGVGYEGCAQPQIWMAAILVDDDRALDAQDRSFPAFWLPFQDVKSHNHSAQWVEKVQGPPPGGDAGAGSDGGTCGEQGATCNPAACCSDTICCGTTCQYTCLR